MALFAVPKEATYCITSQIDPQFLSYMLSVFHELKLEVPIGWYNRPFRVFMNRERVSGINVAHSLSARSHQKELDNTTVGGLLIFLLPSPVTS